MMAFARLPPVYSLKRLLLTFAIFPNFGTDISVREIELKTVKDIVAVDRLPWRGGGGGWEMKEKSTI